MRIVDMDPVLGVSKVVWKFTEEAEPAMNPAPEVSVLADQNLASDSWEGNGQTEGEGEEATANQVFEPDHLEDLRSQIRFLQQVIESQNHQLKSKDELIRNFQVLLKNEQEQVMKLGPAPEAKSSDKSDNVGNTTWLSLLRRKWTKHER